MALYTTSLDVAVPAPVLYEWLADVTLHERYLPDLTVAEVQSPNGVLQPGTTWRESRRGLLFLRDWSQVECTAADSAAGSLSLVRDDGYNCIATQYVVTPLSPTTARVTQELSCSTRAGGELAPSPKLAGYMARQDSRLPRLKEHLEALGSTAPLRSLSGTERQRRECARTPMLAF